MTNQEAQDLLARQAKLEGISDTDLTAQVQAAMANGLRRFWLMKPWSFRRREYTLATTSAATDYTLPEDTGAIGEIRDQTISTGYTITVLSKDEFDRRFPKPDYYPVEVPAYAAVWYDQSAVQSERNKIRFFPRPSGTRSFVIDVFNAPPQSWEAVPGRFVDVALSCAAKMLLKIGSLEWRMAEETIQADAARLDAEDTMYQGRPSTMTVEFPTVDGESRRMIPWA